jgi:class 3 adenylate cyclase
MGLHNGEGRLGGDSYAGLDVHRAARIAGLAQGGQVLLSASTRSLVEDVLPDGVSLRDLGAHQLKDFDQPERLVQLVIEGLANDFPALESLDMRVALPREATSYVGRRRRSTRCRGC